MESGTTWARLGTLLGAIVYVSWFTWTYSTYLAPSYGYMGLDWIEPDPSLLLMLQATAVLPTLWMPLSMRRPSVLIYGFLYVFVLVPAVLVPAFAGLELPGGPLGSAASLVGAYALLGTIYLVEPGGRLVIRGTSWSTGMIVGAGFAVLAMYGLVVTRYGFRLTPPSLTNVYDVRTEYKLARSQGGVLVAYALLWLGQVIHPFLLAYGLTRRKTWAIAAALIGQLFLFSTTGLKGLVFGMLLVPALLLAVRDRGEGHGFSLLVVWGAVALVGLGTLEVVTLGTEYVNGIAVRRSIAVPGLLTGWYFEFFHHNPKAFLTHSVLGGILSAPYDQPPPQVVGGHYFGPRLHANANLWADAYANFGLLGVYVFTAALGGLLWIFDRIAHGADLRLVAALVVIPAVSLSNSALLTTLLTHGLGLAILLAASLPDEALGREVRA